jgi:serine/threonine protein kinase
VIYRDLKPSNVILKPSGEVMLVDFGIARHFRAAKTATMVGTPGYAAPEQWKGKAEPRSDVYALGALLHQMLSGRNPSAEPPFSFPPLEALCSRCTPEIAALVNDSLRYDLGQRVSSIVVFRKRLVEASMAARVKIAAAQASEAATLHVPQPVSAPKSASRFLRRKWSSALVTADVAVLVGIAVWNNPSSNSPPATPSPSDESSSAVSPESPKYLPAESPGAEASPSRSEIHVDKLRRESRTLRTLEARRPALTLCLRHFGEGWTSDDVRSLQGSPTRITASTWWYGACWVRFSSDWHIKQFGGWKPVAIGDVSKAIVPSLRTPATSPLLPSARAETARRQGYFTVGSTKNDVLAIQGTLDRFTDNSFQFGLSSVYFDSNGHVTGWENSAFKELKVRMLPRVASARSYFVIGSSKDEVLAIQRTPDRFTDTSFNYGLSSVYFADGRVISWENSAFKELKVSMLAKVAPARRYFTIGSTKDEVLAVQGTPDRFTDSSFHYGLSSVYFDGDGRVTSWENSAFKELKVRMILQGGEDAGS